MYRVLYYSSGSSQCAGVRACACNHIDSTWLPNLASGASCDELFLLELWIKDQQTHLFFASLCMMWTRVWAWSIWCTTVIKVCLGCLRRRLPCATQRPSGRAPPASGVPRLLPSNLELHRLVEQFLELNYGSAKFLAWQQRSSIRKQ